MKGLSQRLLTELKSKDLLVFDCSVIYILSIDINKLKFYLKLTEELLISQKAF